MSTRKPKFRVGEQLHIKGKTSYYVATVVAIRIDIMGGALNRYLVDVMPHAVQPKTEEWCLSLHGVVQTWAHLEWYWESELRKMRPKEKARWKKRLQELKE